MRWPPPPDWPHVALSRQVLAAPHRWHVQETGDGPLILMLHGAGGSTHSLRGLIREISRRRRIVAIDLPGQGFTQLGARHRCGLDKMAEDVESLCARNGWAPDAIVGHSAGSALGLRLSQTLLSPRGQAPKIVGINPALDSFDGIAGVMFPAIAKMLAAIPFSASVFSTTASSPSRVQALIRSTGSELDAEGLEFYRRLVADRDHVDGTLLMMAQWSLNALIRDLPTLRAEALFLVGTRDGTVPPRVAQDAAQRMSNASVIKLDGFGHLVHEEAPEQVAALILEFLDS